MRARKTRNCDEKKKKTIGSVNKGANKFLMVMMMIFFVVLFILVYLSKLILCRMYEKGNIKYMHVHVFFILGLMIFGRLTLLQHFSENNL